MFNRNLCERTCWVLIGRQVTLFRSRPWMPGFMVGVAVLNGGQCACFCRFLMRCDDLLHIKVGATPRALCRVGPEIFTCRTTEWEGWKSMALTLMSVRLSVSVSQCWGVSVSEWVCKWVWVWCDSNGDDDGFVIVVTPLRIHQDVWLSTSGICLWMANASVSANVCVCQCICVLLLRCCLRMRDASRGR